MTYKHQIIGIVLSTIFFASLLGLVFFDYLFGVMGDDLSLTLMIFFIGSGLVNIGVQFYLFYLFLNKLEVWKREQND